MRHPSYLLNPGDMFQVNPESVLFATGKKKASPAGKPGQSSEEGGEEDAAVEEVEAEEAAVEEEVSTSEGTEKEVPEAAEVDAEAQKETISRELRFLTKAAKEILQQQKGDLKVKQKRRFRDFIKMSRDALSRAGRAGGAEAVASDKTVVDEINSMLRDLVVSDPKVGEKAEETGVFTADEVHKASEVTEKKEETEVEKTEPKGYIMSDKEVQQMNKLLKEWEDNPEDPSKPYLTPWEPRRFMGAFAYIPRYLEVNQNICAAVYLRHPVARQRYAEVPTPFPPHVMQLAFNWYLRRR